jgi:uncharacterized membrane protein YdjX (TVP38/TMEM64 family)
MKRRVFSIISGIGVIIGLLIVSYMIIHNDITQLWKIAGLISFTAVCILYGMVLYEDQIIKNNLPQTINQ